MIYIIPYEIMGFFGKLFGGEQTHNRFKKGKQDGLRYGTTQNGKSYKGYFDEGIQTGKWIFYYPRMNIESEGNLLNGKKDGKWINYYENGNIKAKSNFENGIREGKWTFYYEDGNIKHEEYYKNGVIDGKVVRYYENGLIKCIFENKNGELIESSYKEFDYDIYQPHNIKKIFLYDTETTGTEPGKDYIVQFGGIYGYLNVNTWEFKELLQINQLINVPIKIPKSASDIHHIYDSDVVGYDYISTYINTFLAYIKDADFIVGHNINFDKKMLLGECKRLGIEIDIDSFDSSKWVDTMTTTASLVGIYRGDGTYKWPKLSELYTFLFGKSFDDAHDAMADITATKDCLIELCKRYNFYSNGKFEEINSGNITYDRSSCCNSVGYKKPSNSESNVWNGENPKSWLEYGQDGYNKYGFNREGYDRNGYDKIGYNKKGYDEDGYDRNGYDEDGYDRNGYDEDGYDRNGYNEDGYNRRGYNEDGFDRDGYNRNGFNEDGWNKKGINKNTGTKYDENGFDWNGFNKKKINQDTGTKYSIYHFDIDGINEFTKTIFDEDGFDKDGFDKDGFDRDGFDKDGFDKDGFDKDGFDENGIDENGFNKKGFKKNGIHKNTGTKYNEDGFDKDGFDENGFDENGINKNTGTKYDEDGYKKDGFDRLGFKRNGYDKSGYDRDGYNEQGYNREGYDKNGYDRYGYDKYGFDRNGNERPDNRDYFHDGPDPDEGLTYDVDLGIMR